MTCIIIEDQPPAQRILKKYISDVDSLELKATFSDALQAMDFLKTTTVDLIFLDIHLPKISGIDFLKTYPILPSIILTTAFPDYALESYDLDVVDYLLKPFSFQRFVKAVSKVPLKNTKDDRIEKAPSLLKDIFIKSGYEHIRVQIKDILYIKSDGDYTEIFTPAKKYLSNESLKHWLEELPEQQFMRIHKSYIIHTTKINKITSNQIQLTNQIHIPIGRAYKEVLKKRFIN